MGVFLPGAALGFVQRQGEPPTRAGFAAEMAERLAECFRTGFDAGVLPHRILDCTPFQVRVLEACRRIPHGQTWSYARLAAEAGAPRAIRAAASVMAMNPLPLVIPCHRVERSGGSPGRYGGGTRMKQVLLGLETGAHTVR